MSRIAKQQLPEKSVRDIDDSKGTYMSRTRDDRFFFFLYLFLFLIVDFSLFYIRSESLSITLQ